MLKLELKLSEDRSEIEVTAPDGKGTMTAEGLEGLMRDLALMRANMLPAMPNEGMKPDAVWSVVPCNRWQTAPDLDAPTQIRLFLQHLGFGWVWIPLTEQGVSELQDALQLALRNRPTVS